MHNFNAQPKVKCKKCNAKCRRDVMAGIRQNPGGIIFNNPDGTSKMDSFDYRAKTNLHKAQQDRENAAAKSHVGPTPYKS